MGVRLPRPPLALLALVALSACGDSLAVSDCPEQVQVNVSSGTEPAIDWTPRCHLYGLIVSAPGDLNLWSIHGPPQFVICDDDGGGCPTIYNTLFPPISYGVLPPYAFQDIPAPGQQAPVLVAGYPYTVRLSRANAEPGLAAVDTFTVTP